MTGWDCPECRAGKHVNCTGVAWNDDRDEPTECECAEGGHL